MGEAILSFIQANQNVNYSFVIPLIIGYIIVFWVIVSVWLYHDAKKRFKGRKMPALIALANFIFQVPFLLLYLLFRPADEEYSELYSQGGVNVPIVNFLGKNGIAMSLELKINNNSLMPENASEMKIDVSFDSQDQNKMLVQPELAPVSIPALASSEVKKSGFFAKNLWTSFKTKLPKKAPKQEKQKGKNKNKKKKH